MLLAINSTGIPRSIFAIIGKLERVSSDASGKFDRTARLMPQMAKKLLKISRQKHMKSKKMLLRKRKILAREWKNSH